MGLGTSNERKVAEDWKVSRKSMMIGKRWWRVTWLHQQIDNGSKIEEAKSRRNRHHWKEIRKDNVECKRDSIIWWRSVTTDEERYTQTKVGQKELKKILSKRKKRNKQGPTEELQSEIPKQYGEDNFGWLQRNTDPKKTSSIFALQEQMILVD